MDRRRRRRQKSSSRRVAAVVRIRRGIIIRIRRVVGERAQTRARRRRPHPDDAVVAPAHQDRRVRVELDARHRVGVRGDDVDALARANVPQADRLVARPAREEIARGAAEVAREDVGGVPAEHANAPPAVPRVRQEVRGRRERSLRKSRGRRIGRRGNRIILFVRVPMILVVVVDSPEVEVLVVARAGEVAPARAPAHVRAPLLVAEEDERARPVRDAPHADRPVRARGGEARAVGGEAHGRDRLGVADEDAVLAEASGAGALGRRRRGGRAHRETRPRAGGGGGARRRARRR